MSTLPVPGAFTVPYQNSAGPSFAKVSYFAGSKSIDGADVAAVLYTVAVAEAFRVVPDVQDQERARLIQEINRSAETEAATFVRLDVAWADPAPSNGARSAAQPTLTIPTQFRIMLMMRIRISLESIPNRGSQPNGCHPIVCRWWYLKVSSRLVRFRRQFLSIVSLIVLLFGTTSCWFGPGNSGSGNGINPLNPDGAPGERKGIDEKEGSGGPGPDGSPQVNAEGISGGGETRAYLDSIRDVVIDTLVDLRDGAPINTSSICLDQNSSCMPAFNRDAAEYETALNYLHDNIEAMIDIHQRSTPVPLLLALTGLTVLENGQRVARDVIAMWHPREEILFDFVRLTTSLIALPQRYLARFTVTDLIHETVHLVKWKGERVLDDSVYPGFSGSRGGARMAQLLGAIISDHAHRRGFVANHLGGYPVPMSDWRCHIFSADYANDPANNLTNRFTINALTSSIHQVEFETENHCTDIYARIGLQENLNTSNYVDLGTLIIRASGRSTMSIPAAAMARLLGNRSLLSDVSLIVSTGQAVPNTGSCSYSGWVARAKVAVFLHSYGTGVPPRSCGF